MSAVRNLILLGQCVPCVKQTASKIRIRRMELDTNLNMVRKSKAAAAEPNNSNRNFHSTNRKNLASSTSKKMNSSLPMIPRKSARQAILS